MLIYRVKLRTNSEDQTIAEVNISRHYKLQINCQERINDELKQYLQNIILKYLQICEQKKIKLEPPEEIDSNDEDNNLEVLIPVNYELKKGSFEKIFPVIGHLSNMLSILSLGFVSYLAMRVTVGNNNDEARVFSFGGAIYTLLITFCIYVFSGASRGLAAMGRKIDAAIIKKPSRLSQSFDLNNDSNLEHQVQEKVILLPNNEESAQTSVKKILLGLGAGAAVVLNSGINGITTYQQVNTLAKVAVSSQEEYLLRIVTVLPFILIISAGISNSAFQWSFIRDALDFLTQCCGKKRIMSVEELTEKDPILVENNKSEDKKGNDQDYGNSVLIYGNNH